MPGRLVADAGLKLLIQNAYTLQPFQIEGAPEVRYRIEATAGSVVSHQQLFLMLQSLLEERFQLKYNRETRDLPVYALVAARGGLKLPPPKEGNCVVPPPDAPNEWAGGRMQPPQPGQQPPLPRCGSVSLALMYDRVHMQGGQVPMQELTRVLSMVLGRIVIDRTGYSKPFDVRLDFQADQTTSALPPPPPGTPESDQPSIVPALQDQLGLRLESTKGPVEVMVIDHVERPSAN